MKKICFIVSDPVTAKVFLKNPIIELSKKYEIHLAANFSNKEDKLKLEGVTQTHYIPLERKISLFKDLRCLFQIYKYLKINNFDAVHSITPKAGLLSMLAGALAKIKMRTHTFTGQVWANKTGLYSKLLMNLDKAINLCATHILVDGKSQRNFLIEHKIINQKAHVLGNGSICGVEIEKFKPSLKARNITRTKLGFNENDWVFLFLGRINIEKGVYDLIKAFSDIKEDYNQKLVLVGNDEENLLSNHLKSVNYKNIFHIPFTNKPEEVLQACDTFCLPSYREGFGMSVIEASSLEKPIICSNIYGLEDTVINNETGIKHKVKSILDLNKKLEFALNNKELMIQMGLNGRKYVSDNFSEKLILREWKNFYFLNI